MHIFPLFKHIQLSKQPTNLTLCRPEEMPPWARWASGPLVLTPGLEGLGSPSFVVGRTPISSFRGRVCLASSGGWGLL